MKRDLRFYWTLFVNTFLLSAFTVGGGYVIIALMQERFIRKLGWLKEDEMMDMMAIAQTTPGSVAVNACLMLGFRLAGVIGVFVTLTATILPPLVCLIAVSICYNFISHDPTVKMVFQGMQAGIAAIIVHVAWGMGVSEIRQVWSMIAVVIAFIAVFFLHIHVAIVFLVCALLGVARFFYLKRHSSEIQS